MVADVAPLAAGDESICDSLSRSLCADDVVKCTGAWTLPEPWAQRTRPPLLGKPPRTRFPTPSTRIIVFSRSTKRTKVVNQLYTRNSGQSPWTSLPNDGKPRTETENRNLKQ